MVKLRMSDTNEDEPTRTELQQTSTSLHIGDRVQVGNHRATIKYVGPVLQTKGLWLGVDWDDPSRGKHDGEYRGQRYFTARYPVSGSLVRLEKVEIGQSICDAIKDRYGGPGQVMPADQLEEIRRALNTPFLEMVGLERPADDKDTYIKLNVVGVSEYRVSSAGESEDALAILCPLVRELDMSRNLFSSWKPISDIAKQLPFLRFLDISENRLSFDEESIESFKDSFKTLSVIILSKMEYTWQDILSCAEMWPQIEKLQISFNNITNLSVPPSHLFNNLRVLNIEGNNIKHWAEVEKLGHLPRLECLNASNIGLTNITISSSDIFPALKYILLSDNYINNWESISELAKLEALEELKLRENPILESFSRETTRQMIIARLPSLKILNLQEIEPEERRGAEIDYLKTYAREWCKCDSSSRADFLVHHPIYPTLIKRYGEFDISEVANENMMCLKSRLVNIKLVHGNAEITKRLPDSMLVSTLATLALSRLMRGCSRTYQPNLILVSPQEPNMRIPMDDSMKTLSYYSVADGDMVLIE